jgi:hypothetical protein
VAHAQARDLGLLAESEKAWEVENWKERVRSFSRKELSIHKKINQGPTVKKI